MKEEKQLSRSITGLKFTKPRSSQAFGVENQDGASTGWGVILGSAASRGQRGFDPSGPNALRTGDEIKLKFLLARDASSLGFLKTVIMPDGRVIRISANHPND